MSQRVSVDQLAVGMYLVGIDKPWMQTPFLRHHFKISSEAQIAKLKTSGVRIVEVDPERGLAPSHNTHQEDGPSAPARENSSDVQDLSGGINASDQAESKSSDTHQKEGKIGAEGASTRVHRTITVEGTTEFTSLLRVRMLLQLAFPSQRQQHSLCTTRLLGWSDRNFLLTELPFYEGHAIEFRPGILGIVRFVESGRVFGFKTETIRGQFSPIPLLFLAFPQEIEELCLRRSPRIPVALKGELRPAAGADSPIHGIVRDLSLSGCRVELTSPDVVPLQGAAVALDLHLPGTGTLEGLSGLIRNVSTKPSRTETHSTKVLVGIEFEFQHTDPATPAAVERFISDQLALSRT